MVEGARLEIARWSCERRHYVITLAVPLRLKPALRPASLAELWRDSSTPRAWHRPRFVTSAQRATIAAMPPAPMIYLVDTGPNVCGAGALLLT